MKAMLRSGEMLYLLSDETRDLFDQAVADLTQKLQIRDATEPVLQAVAGLSTQVRVCKRQIGELLNRLRLDRFCVAPWKPIWQAKLEILLSLDQEWNIYGGLCLKSQGFCEDMSFMFHFIVRNAES